MAPSTVLRINDPYQQRKKEIPLPPPPPYPTPPSYTPVRKLLSSSWASRDVQRAKETFHMAYRLGLFELQDIKNHMVSAAAIGDMEEAARVFYLAEEGPYFSKGLVKTYAAACKRFGFFEEAQRAEKRANEKGVIFQDPFR